MKKDYIQFPIVFLIYIVAGIVSIILFYNKGSNLSRQLDAETAAIEADAPDDMEPEADTQPDSEEINGEAVEISNPADAVSEPDITDEPVSDNTEADGEDALPEETPVDIDDDAADAPAPSDIEVTTESADDNVEDDGKTYYAFSVNKGVSGVRIRKTSDRKSEILGKISAGDSGYVLESGDPRSKIVTEDGSLTGYVYNEYITITEIPGKDYPKEYR